jgi:hypothetical protein
MRLILVNASKNNFIISVKFYLSQSVFAIDNINDKL